VRYLAYYVNGECFNLLHSQIARKLTGESYQDLFSVPSFRRLQVEAWYRLLKRS
jgi:hypothetical protein